MKSTFANFSKILSEGSSDYGIPHVEDLDLETFIRAIENLHELKAVQKLDGANLRAGIDQRGRLYASREQKGGRRFYKQSDFPKSSAYDAFRTAFEVLKQNEELVSEVMSPGEAINIEVIFGDQPNTVLYGKHNLCYLAILEMVVGDDPSIDPDQDKVEMLVKKFGNKIYHVETMVSDTSDGEQIARAPRVTDWKIITSDAVKSHEKIDVSPKLNGLKELLKQSNKAAVKLGKDLSNFEVLKDRSRDLSNERDVLNEKIRIEFKLPIKQDLLKLVAKQRPSLRGMTNNEPGVYDGIEGIIFIDPKTREKFKVVDRDVFTKVNQFNYQARKGVASRAVTARPDAPLEQRGGIVGEARLRAINLFGLQSAELATQAKRTLAKFKGTDRTATLKNIVDSLHQLHFDSVKRKIQSIYASALDDLDEALASFKQHADEYKLKLDDGREIKYTPEIKRRTLLTFAESRRTIFEMLSKLRSATSMEQLIEIFFERQLSQLHGSHEAD